MSEGSILRTTIAGILGIIIVRNSIDEQVPTCVLAMPAKNVAMPSCPVQHPMLHSHHEEAITLTPIVVQLAGVTSGSSSFYGELTNATPILASAADCPAKNQAPLHIETEVDQPTLPTNTTITPDTGALVLNGEAVDILMNPSDDGDGDMALAYNSAPCADKDQAPLHLERNDADTLASDVPPPSPTFKMIQQIMASYQDPANHQTLQPIPQSAAHL